VPLSEHEQQVLRQIERELQRERGFRPLRMPVDPVEASRNAKRASLAFLGGLVLMLVSLSSSWVVGLIGFLVMLFSAVALVQSLRRLAQDHLERSAVAAANSRRGHRVQRSGRESRGLRWPRGGAGAGPEDEQAV
jgi:hypothetical protein